MKLPRIFVFVILIFVVSFVFTPSADGATIVLSIFTDEDSHPLVGSGCALREAIIAANTDAAHGGCAAGSGADTINLAFGTYTLSLGSELLITSQLVIQSASGDETDTIIEAAATPNTVMHRVFNVTSTGNLSLYNVTIRNGGTGIFPIDGGGGIHNAGFLRIEGSIVDNNRSLAGAGIYSTSSLIIDSTDVTNNVAAVQGGGVLATGNTLINNGSQISRNTAPTGGGIFKGGALALLELNFVFLRFNTGTSGVGGIHHSVGDVEIVNSLIEFNTGGGYLNSADTATTYINFSCIVGNSDPAIVDNSSGSSTNVVNVWWGSVEGPYTTMNDTIGDSISGFVTYSDVRDVPVNTFCGACTRASAISGGRDIRTCTPTF